MLFQGDFLSIVTNSFDLFTVFYSNPVSPVGFYCSPVETGEESRRSKRSRTIHKRTAPLSFLPRGGMDGVEKGAGSGTGGGGGRRETGKRGWEREREPDVLIKRLIFIARQKR